MALTSCAAVGAVSERAEQQRQVEVLVRIADVEGDLDLRKEGHAEALVAVEGADVERQAVVARRYRSLGERVHAPFFVGGAAADRRPLAGLAQLEDDGDAFGRFAARDVEQVCGDHEMVSGSCSSSLVSRSRVILRCSSAAMRSSSPASCRSRVSSSASISAAVLPGAQTMKM